MQTNDKNISWFWIVVLILQYYVDGTILMALIVLNIFYFCKFKLPKCNELGLTSFFLLLVVGASLGFYYINNYQIRDYIRDIYYYLQPIIYIYAGYIIYLKRKDEYTFFRTVCYAAAVLALIYAVNLLQNPTLLTSDTVIGIRQDVGKEQFILLVATIFLATKKHIFSPKVQMILLGLIGGIFALQFSRTAYGTLVIIALVLFMQTGKLTVSLVKKIILVLFAVVIFWNILPNNLTADFTMRIMRSLAEVSADKTFQTLQDVQSNWRGYENHIVMKEVFEEGNLLNTLMGYGFGKTASLFGFVVNLGGNDFSNISTFHNGYLIVLLKNGVIGLITYLLFFFNTIRYNWRYNVYESKLAIAFVFGMLFMTYTKGGILRGSSVLEFCLIIGYAAGVRTELLNSEISVKQF
ncbi:TPA: hypothetical protein ACIEBX_000734 [Enterococcus faecium]